MEKGTNYRNVYKSDHLGAVDLDEFIESGKDLIFTIKYVKQEMGAKVAGNKIDANIAYFVENIKPLVLNATNARIISRFAKSTHVEKWNNIPVELYIDHNVKFKGVTVDGVRVKQRQPNIVKKLPSINDSSFTRLLAALENKTFEYSAAIATFSFNESQTKSLEPYVTK